MSLLISGNYYYYHYYYNYYYYYYNHHHYYYDHYHYYNKGARDQCIYNDKKTIDNDDILDAMLHMGFLDQRLCLFQYMNKYNESIEQTLPPPPPPSSSLSSTTITSKPIKERKPHKEKAAADPGKIRKKYYIPKKLRPQIT